MRIGDNITVLRDGKIVAHAEVADINISWIVKNMVGSDKGYQKRVSNTDWNKRETVLEVKGLSLPKKGGGFLLENVSLCIVSK